MRLLKLCLLVAATNAVYAGQEVADTSSLQTAAKTRDQSFVVFDATLYEHKPDMPAYGIKPIKIFYEWDLWGKWRNRDTQSTPRSNDVKRAAHEARSLGPFAIIDIEHWPLIGEDSVVQESLRKYRTVLARFREASPATKFGYYGAPPIVDYWRAGKTPDSHEHRSWRRDNDRIASLAQDVDVLFPSAYTFYGDQAGWQKYAIAQINAARDYNYGKPVYVFLWPQYHESNPILGGKYLPTDYWRMELDTALKHADGIVIWGGWQQKWDENAEWWHATKQFMLGLKTNGLKQ